MQDPFLSSLVAHYLYGPMCFENSPDLNFQSLNRAGGFLTTILKYQKDHSISLFSRKYICLKELSSSILVFMWRLLNKFLDLDDIRKTLGFQLAQWCHYGTDEESFEHVFLHCRYARYICLHFANFMLFFAFNPSYMLSSIFTSFTNIELTLLFMIFFLL